MKNRKAKDYVRVDGPGQQTITSLAYWLTPAGINPVTAKLAWDDIDSESDADFSEKYDGATKEEAREFLETWELCFMPYWSADEVAHAIEISGGGRDATRVLRSIMLAQQAGELSQAFAPLRGVEWAMARGYLINNVICELVGAKPGEYGHPHNEIVTPEEIAEPSTEKAGSVSMPVSPLLVPANSSTPKQRRDALDLSRERGARRRILEQWDVIEAEYGPAADAHEVARVLKRDEDEDEPSLKTIQNRLSELRREGLIP